jgi:hypothetical protein
VGVGILLSGSSYGGAMVKFAATAVAAKKELAPQLPYFSGEYSYAILLPPLGRLSNWNPGFLKVY